MTTNHSKHILSMAAVALAGCALDAQQGADPTTDTGATHGVLPETSPATPRTIKPVTLGGEQLLSYPVSMLLDTSETPYFVEPEGGTKVDDGGHTYTDNNYWNFCGPGAEAVVLYYSPWRNNPKYGTTKTYYAEQYGPHVSSTYWTSPSYDKTYGYYTVWRPSIMYLAEYSKPPVFSTPGVDGFSTYPTTGSTTGDVCDSLNWEASDHASSSSYCGSGSYFYAQVSGSYDFHQHVVSDLNAIAHGWTGWAVWVSVNTYVSSTYRLPNWSRSLTHAIAVVGYDDNAGTYTYIDTCGIHCNGSSGNQKSNRMFTVSQSVLHDIMNSHIW